MDEKTLKKLLSRITGRRYVNLYFKGGDEQNASKTAKIVEKIIEGKQAEDYYINVDIQKLPKSESKALKRFIKIINDNLAKAKFKHWIHKAISIDNALKQLNERLEKSALIIFHLFRDPDNEKEKRILSYIRKFIEMKNSIFLGILIISTESTGNWDLSPYSDLDERYVEMIDWNTLAVDDMTV